MIVFTALSFAALGLFAQTPASASQAPVSDWIAMTRSGVQIEIIAEVPKGTLEVQTPYGLFRTATDPVEFSFQRQRDRSWVSGMRTSNSATLQEAIGVFRDNGQISALLEVSQAAIQRNWPDEIRSALGGLEQWGAQIDPVPAKFSSEKRVEWLWEKVQETEGPRKLLFSGRLATELIPGGNGVGIRQLSLMDFRRAFKSDDVLLQRAALQFVEVQSMGDSHLGARVQTMSLYGHPVCQDRAAHTAVVLREAAAREYWVRALLRASDSIRMIAARNLALELPQYAVKPFAFLLSAAGKLAPSRFKFSEHSIQVVVDRRAPTSLMQLELAFSQNGTLEGEYLEASSVIKTLKVPDLLRVQIQRHLVQLAGDDKERTLEEWLIWYKAQNSKP